MTPALSIRIAWALHLGFFAFLAAAKTEAGLPPLKVTIVSPTNGTIFKAPATIPILAQAEGLGGFVRAVEFLQNGKSLGVVTNNPVSSMPMNPFRLTWTNVPSGDYTLTVRAVDNTGASALSPAVKVSVTSASETSSFSAKINFQTASASVPAGYRADTGSVYGSRGAGLTYGWDKDNRANTRNRNSTQSPDQRYDTFAYMQRDNQNFTWELSVPNGSYEVKVVAGDPTSYDSVFGIDIEGFSAIQGAPSSSKRWLEGTVLAQVNDGRLTVRNRPEAKNNKISFIEVKGGSQTSLPPKVQIAAPADQTTFIAGADVTFRIEASDADGYIPMVELFAGTTRVGFERRDYLVKPPPGEPATFHIVWKGVPGGEHVLTAKATDDSGSVGTSAPIKIRALSGAGSSIVTIFASDAEALESNPLNTGVFKVVRTGNLQRKLEVRYSVSGNALNGIDYERLSGRVTIPAGETSAPITVKAIPDKALEGKESVILTVIQPVLLPILPPEENYLVGTPKSATVTIYEDEVAREATLVITSPRMDETFPANSTIPIKATAIDPKGYIDRVEFFANNQRIGVSEINFIRAPDPGTPIFHSIEWRNVPPGPYELTAKAKDSAGKDLSSPKVKITVGAAPARPVVERRLPASYAPGVPLTVELVATPSAGTTTYAVEDKIPTGWLAVTNISDAGAFDSVNRKVKFGPFFDNRPRTLRYTLTPPAGELAEKVFAGSASVDGVDSAIGGASRINSALLHPADNNPGDHRITLSEVTAYGAAWKTGKSWPINPNPIPIGYVTRAGALWKGGETYVYDPKAGSAPQWWVNARLAAPGAADARSLGVSSAVREIVRTASVNHPPTVTIHVHAGPQVASQAVEEQVPQGLVVSNISEDGAFDATTRKVRWGPFFDNRSRILSYQINGAAHASSGPNFAGLVSFDGHDREITGIGEAGSRNASSHAALHSIQRLPAEGVELIWRGEIGETYQIEATHDFREWLELGKVTPAESTFRFIDRDGLSLKQRFYRARRAPSAD